VQSERESVAKDWLLTIRASQVIPIYPLSEDVQPGDVYLVTETVDEQHDAWRRSGYVPLPIHLDRITLTGYRKMYADSFGELASRTIPRALVEPSGDERGWDAAPIVGFPAYSFTVGREAGASVSLPVSGVPVGLGFLGADSATGTVTLADARTFGVDLASLRADVNNWAAKSETRELLAHFASQGGSDGRKGSGPPRFIRVINRVFAVKTIDVSLSSGANSGVSATVGAGAPAAPGVTRAVGEEAGYAVTLDQLNRSAELFSGERSALPGGALRFTGFSQSSVSMRETFDSPIVIGYHAFDFRVRETGELGPPVPTLSVVGRSVVPPDAPFGPFSEGEGVLMDALDQADELSPRQQSFAYERAAAAIDQQNAYQSQLADDPGNPREAFVASVQTMLGEAEGRTRELRLAQAARALYDAMRSARVLEPTD
jgi:hypothetical protein